MSVLGHWLVIPPAGSTFVVKSTEQADHWRGDPGYRVEGPFVPAEQLQGAVARADEAERALRVFQAGLTDALRAHNVPPMPSWPEAIHWLARHGGQ